LIGRIVTAAVIIALALGGWLLVQAAARRFAARHPEFGPAREEGGGCGSCADHGTCERRHSCDDT
jgi:Spy/CpxP family protein refolding chaperone